MFSFVLIIILIFLFLVPAIAMASKPDDEYRVVGGTPEDGNLLGSGDSLVEDVLSQFDDPDDPMIFGFDERTSLNQPTKIMIPRNLIYHLQGGNYLAANPETNRGFNNVANSPIEWNKYSFLDLFRRLTMRTWYAYGWARESNIIEYKSPGVSKPVFGYFPIMDESEDKVREKLQDFYERFNDRVIINASDPSPFNEKNYFKHMPLAPAPEVYISEFGEEWSVWDLITELLVDIEGCPEGDWNERINCVRDLVDNLPSMFPGGVPDIELNHWKSSQVVIRGFESSMLALDSRYSETERSFPDLVEQVIQPFLSTTVTYAGPDSYIYGSGEGRPDPECPPIDVPKRYYDHTFQFKTADNNARATSEYNGYFAQLYEETVNDMPLILEPVFPNVYIVNFARTTVREYYNLISLKNPNWRAESPKYFTPEFPGRLSDDYQALFEPLGWSSQHTYPRLWSLGMKYALQEHGTSLVDLAKENEKLIFSDLFSEEYKTFASDTEPLLPYYNKIDFPDFSSILGKHEFGDLFDVSSKREDTDTPLAHSAITHLISDTQLTDKIVNATLFATAHSPKAMEAEFNSDISTREHNGHSTHLLEKFRDFSYEVCNVWDIHEWFKLYCIPEIVNSSDTWDQFFQSRDFRDQWAMLYASPETWHRKSGPPRKPLPVGAAANPVATSVSERRRKTLDSRDKLSAILATPGGSVWENCMGTTTFLDALTSLYRNINLKLSRLAGNFRSYEEVMNGKLAYSEPLFFRLERRPKIELPPGIDAIANQGVQNFFFDSKLLRDGFSYLDAQVHYGVEYEYFLYGYYFVLGNEYWYKPGVGEADYTSVERAQQWTQAKESASRETICDDLLREYNRGNMYDQDGEIYEGPFNEYGCPYNFFDGDGRLHIVEDCRGLYKAVRVGEGILLDETSQCPSWFYDARESIQIIDPAAAAETLGLYEEIGTATVVETWVLDRDGNIMFETSNPVPLADSRVQSDSDELVSGDQKLYYTYTERKVWGTTADDDERVSAWYIDIIYYKRTTAEPSGQVFHFSTEASDLGDNIERISSTPGLVDAFFAVRHDAETVVMPPPEINKYTFTVLNRPNIALVETAMFSPDKTSMTTKIVDDPPPPPDVEIIPYLGIKDKVLLTMNSNQGSYVDNPIIIDQRQDLNMYRSIILNQSEDPDLRSEDITLSNVEDYEIFFNSDDYILRFEIYRTDFPPSSYVDFIRGRKIVLNNTRMGVVVSTANSMVDEVIPNKKYWYTFRSIDVHNNLSNPTGVIQFEIVDTGNSVFPVIEDYRFPEPSVTYNKPMKKYLMISPAPLQKDRKRQEDDSPDGFVNNSHLGANAAESAWGKKYKLRVTSKLTGKKVDINFSFKQKALEDKRISSSHDHGPTTQQQLMRTIRDEGWGGFNTPAKRDPFE